MTSSELSLRESVSDIVAAGSYIKEEFSSLHTRNGGVRHGMQHSHASSEPRDEDTSFSKLKTDLNSRRELATAWLDSSNLAMEEESVDTNHWIHGFEHGDMVWGKVKSHPWWPGQIYNEAFVSSSVRRTKREGYVLVAFFGDSSYGWFDPTELIPFEMHFAEKSRQTTAKNFTKAVDEALDEAGRRQALGIVCLCRKPFNFRPTSVSGYFIVDVDASEPGVYSSKQIRRARSDFSPHETVSFIHQLAVEPTVAENSRIDRIKNISRVRAYRKAVFEEFDETYAQAFGVEPLKPLQGSLAPPEQAGKLPSRAPFSGPLVIAESLGGRKSSLKSVKLKDLLKKDKYHFKRGEIPTGSLPVEGSSVLTDGSALQIEVSPMSCHGIVPALDTGKKDADDEAIISSLFKSGAEEDKHSVIEPASAGFDLQISETSFHVDASLVDGEQDVKPKPGRESRTTCSTPQAFSGADIVDSNTEFIDVGYSLLSKSSLATDKEVPSVGEKVVMGPPEDMVSEKSDMGERRKNRRKKDSEYERDLCHSQKKARIQESESLKKNADLSLAVGSAVGVHLKNDSPKGGLHSPLRCLTSEMPLELDLDHIDFTELVDDLLSLALDPFHESGYDRPDLVRNVFLKFRSLVFQKSLSPSSVNESEISEKPEVESVGSAVSLTRLSVQDQTESKQLKGPLRPDDPTKRGRKRAPSDRQEEMSAKRIQKLKALKSITSDKKTTSQYALDGQKNEGKEGRIPTPVKSMTQVSLKKDAPVIKPVELTSLMMKFPPQTQLPSVPQLNAQFVRFGPLDVHWTRVYWKTSSCRVIFKHKSDAQAAYKHATRTSTLFGPTKVVYSIKDFDVPGRAPPSEMEQNKLQPGDGATSLPFTQQSGFDFLREPKLPLQLQGTPAQLKSCLKKLPGEDMCPTMVKESPRVKFLLDPDGTSANGTVNNGDARLGSSFSLVVNSSNGVKTTTVIAPVLPSTNSAAAQISSRGIPSLTTACEKSGNDGDGGSIIKSFSEVHVNKEESVDISYQMLTLMMRCSDIVMSVKYTLGYIPYRPL